MRRFLGAFSGLFITAGLIGCGESGPPKEPLQRASGKVTADGRPAAGVEVRLRPFDRPDSLDALTPFATTGEDGGFELGTYEKGDGAPEGRYKVTLFWPDRPPGPQHPNDLLGGLYDSPAKTTLEATIAKGENTIPTFEVSKAAVKPRPATPRKGRRVDSDGVE